MYCTPSTHKLSKSNRRVYRIRGNTCFAPRRKVAYELRPWYLNQKIFNSLFDK